MAREERDDGNASVDTSDVPAAIRTDGSTAAGGIVAADDDIVEGLLVVFSSECV